MSKHIANVQITKPSCSSGKDKVVIYINCESSNLRIIEVEMDPADFLSAVMGRGDMKGEVVYWDHAKAVNVGKNRIAKTVMIEKPPGHDRQASAKYIRGHRDILEAMKDGWEIHDDGLSSRQDGNKHKVVLRRYEDNKNERDKL